MAALRSAYLNTRITMLSGRLIPDEQLDEWVDQTLSEAELSLALLRESTIARETLPTELHRRSESAEQHLLTALLLDFQIITRALAGADRAFIVYGIHWFELANLKAIIRGKLSGQPNREIREQMADVGPFATLPLEDLMRTEDTAELLRLLESTPYADIARQARRTLEEHHDLFAVDAAIDRRYFKGMLKKLELVEASEREPVQELTGLLLDRFNLIWLLRYRFSYGLSPAEAFYLLVPPTRRLTVERLRALAQLPSFDAVLEALPEAMRRWLGNARNISEVEDQLERHVRKTAEAALRDRTHVLVRAFAYLLLRESEMRRVSAILEGKRLAFPPDLVRRAAGLYRLSRLERS